MTAGVTNVLHLIESWGPGGAETVCIDLATGLDRSRYHSTGAVIREGWVFDTMRARGLDPAIVRTGRLPLDVRFLAGLVRLARRRKVRLIQSHLLGANVYSSLAGLGLRMPVVATFHGTVDLGTQPRLTGIKLKTVSAGSQMVFVSGALRRAILGDAPPPNAHVIHNGIDAERFAPRPSASLKAELGLPPHTVLVGAVGNIRAAKAYDALLDVTATLADAPDVVFVVVGKPRPGLFEELEARHRSLGLGARVRFLGYRDDVPALLNGLDVYLSTSRSEGFSLTTVQAMACGVPVVATRSGGPEEIVTDGEDGTLVPVDDIATIAGAVRRYAADAALRRRAGEAGRAKVLRQFTVHRMVAAYEQLYEAALSG